MVMVNLIKGKLILKLALCHIANIDSSLNSFYVSDSFLDHCSNEKSIFYWFTFNKNGLLLMSLLITFCIFITFLKWIWFKITKTRCKDKL